MGRRKAKKVIFILVEGPTDKECYQNLFDVIFDQSQIVFNINHCDITSDFNSTNINHQISNLVKQKIENERIFKAGDLLQIVLMSDTDGCFIDPSKIVEDLDCTKPVYESDCIRTSNCEMIQKRNEIKGQRLSKIASVPEVNVLRKPVPFMAVYNSCNLEHALFHKNNLTPEQKEEFAFKFTDQYEGRETDFIEDSREYLPDGCKAEYAESWRYIKIGTNSLKPGTNVFCLFQELQEYLTPKGLKVLESCIQKENSSI